MNYCFDLNEEQFNGFINIYLPAFEAIYGHNYLLMDKSFLVYVKQGFNPETDQLIRVLIYTNYQPLIDKINVDNKYTNVIDNSFNSPEYLSNYDIWLPVFGKNNINMNLPF